MEASKQHGMKSLQVKVLESLASRLPNCLLLCLCLRLPVQTLLFPTPSNPGSIHGFVCLCVCTAVGLCSKRGRQTMQTRCLPLWPVCSRETKQERNSNNTSKSGWCVEKSEARKGAEANGGGGQSDFWRKIAGVAGRLCAKALRCRCVWHSRRPWRPKHTKQGGGRGAKARGEMGAGSRGGLWTLVAAWSR